jgi:hypothetical protein
MQWWLQIGTNPDREASGSGRMAAWPPSRECNAYKNNATKAKTQEIKSALVAVLLGIDAIGGHAKPD